MGTISKQIFFKAPVEAVWKIWSDVEKSPEWVSGVRECQLTSSTREGRGLCWKEKCLFDRQNIEMNHEMTEWESLKRGVILTELPMGGKMQRSFSFKEAKDGSEVSITMEWDLGMASMFVDERKVETIMRDSLDETLSNWKLRAEAKGK